MTETVAIYQSPPHRAANTSSEFSSSDRYPANSIPILDTLFGTLPLQPVVFQEHSTRVKDVAMGIAEKLGYAPRVIQVIGRGCDMHDIDKAFWEKRDARLLDMGWRVTKELFENVITLHPTRGRELIESEARRLDLVDHPAVQQVLTITEGHHIFFNGMGGYPANPIRKVDQPTRIVTIADSLDSMLTRPYSNYYGNVDGAYNEVIKCMGVQFDPALKDAFTAWFRESRERLHEVVQSIKDSYPLKEKALSI